MAGAEWVLGSDEACLRGSSVSAGCMGPLEGEEGGGGGVKGGGGGEWGDLDLDLGADLKAHRTLGVEHDGVPDDSADRPAMPHDTLPGSSMGLWVNGCVCVKGREGPHMLAAHQTTSAL